MVFLEEQTTGASHNTIGHMNKFKAHRIERLAKTGAKGSNLRHQFILTGYEDYVFIKERRDPIHNEVIQPLVTRKRPVYRHVTHYKNQTRVLASK